MDILQSNILDTGIARISKWDVDISQDLADRVLLVQKLNHLQINASRFSIAQSFSKSLLFDNDFSDTR